MRKWLTALWLGLFALTAGAADRIERIEPASWWVGMQSGRLELLVHGAGAAAFEPSIRYPGVTIKDVQRTDSPNYQFIVLEIAPDTKPGRFRIEFRQAGRKVASHDYVLAAREPGSAQRRGFGPEDAIYLITPDRFADGDPRNDVVKGTRAATSDRKEPFARHGGDIQGVIDHLDYVAGMGFTQLWLNPVQENDQPDASYHGYAITDFYKVDPRFGSNELYRKLAAEARKHGLGLIMDVVLNHCGSMHWWMRDPPARDWFNHDGKFVGTRHVREALQDPHGTEEDRRDYTDGWFVDSMPDLNQRNPHLATYLIQNSLWWIEYAGLSGLRVDTWSYSDRDFLAAWARRVTAEYPQLNVVGEEWSGNPATVAYWQRGRRNADGYESALPALFDFPLQEAVAQGLLEPEGWGTGLRRIYKVLASDGLYPDPYRLVVFPDNHDISRILTKLGERVDLDRMAIAFFLTTRGTPQLLYGTEVLMHNPGTESHGVIRGDFPGGWAGDAKNAFTGQGLSDAERSMQHYVRALLAWRRHAPAVQHGQLTQYVPQDGIYVYFRHTDTQRVMVIVNNNDDARTVATARFHEMIRESRSATEVLSGRQYPLADGVPAPGRSVTILELH
jgi:glycosidase